MVGISKRNRTMTLTPKQEAFCLAYLETGNASEAYRRSYSAERMKPNTVNRRAFDLLEDSKIAARLETAREAARARNAVTVDSLLSELEEARQAALQAEPAPQSSAAVAATMGKAKLMGLDKQVVEHTGPNGKPLQLIGTEVLAALARKHGL